MSDKILQDIESKGWYFQPGLLTPDALKAINEYIDQNREKFAPARVGNAQEKKRMEFIRGDLTYWLNPAEPPEAFSDVVSFLNMLKEILNRTLYLGLKQFEFHLAIYPEGTFYIKHRDRFEEGSSRALSFVFYLHQQWGEGDGGELVLYDKDERPLEKILPLPGSFVCFLSDNFPHEVLPALKERRSLTGWMHTQDLILKGNA